MPAVPAATLALLRGGSRELEVLLLRRSRSAGFVPGAYVFPGGRVDPGDATAEAVALIDYLSPEAAAARLDLTDGEPPAIAYYVAAVREAFEETGILVARRADGTGAPSMTERGLAERVRDDLMEDRIDFAQTLRRMACRVDGRRLAYLAHWITPESGPRRFDTRFFAAEAPPEIEAVIDTREMTDAIWLPPETAVERHRTGGLPMIMPTIRTIEQLAEYRTAAEALEALPQLDVPRILPEIEEIPPDVGLTRR